MTTEPRLLQSDEINALFEMVKVWNHKADRVNIYFGKVCRQVPNTSFMISQKPFLYDETDITVDVREDCDELERRVHRVGAVKNYNSQSQTYLGTYIDKYGEENAKKYFLRCQRIIDDKIRAEKERKAQASRFSLENALSEARRIVAQGGKSR